jgi:hypothetical protein
LKAAAYGPRKYLGGGSVKDAAGKFHVARAKNVPVRDLVAIAPLGSFEQHGPHLPFTTDTDIVSAIAGADGARSLIV